MELTLHNSHAWGGADLHFPQARSHHLWRWRVGSYPGSHARWAQGRMGPRGGKVKRLTVDQFVHEGGRTNRTREAHEPFWRPVAHLPQRPPRPLVKRYLARTTPQPLPPKNVTCGSPPPWTCWKWSRPRGWSTDMADSGTPLTTTSPTSWASTCGHATPRAFERKGKMPPGSSTSAIPVTTWRMSPLTDLSPMTSVPVSPKSALGSLPRDCTQWSVPGSGGISRRKSGRPPYYSHTWLRQASWSTLRLLRPSSPSRSRSKSGCQKAGTSLVQWLASSPRVPKPIGKGSSADSSPTRVN